MLKTIVLCSFFVSISVPGIRSDPEPGKPINSDGPNGPDQPPSGTNVQGFKSDCFSFRNARFRKINGRCNNLRNREWGSAGVAFTRMGTISYEDGVGVPRKYSAVCNTVSEHEKNETCHLPNPRYISRTIHTGNQASLDNKDLSLLVMQWGQFLDHDITLTLPVTSESGEFLMCCSEEKSQNDACLPIELENDDPTFDGECMNFVRSRASTDSEKLGHREQFNVNTAFIDASNVYGSSVADTNRLRTFTGGLLKVSEEGDQDLLPRATTKERQKLECAVKNGQDTCFVAGDLRVNEQPGLTAMHTTWMYEHNRIARALATLNPNWRDRRLFQETRKIIGAMMQHITYNEFLPIILGQNGIKKFGLQVKEGCKRSNYNRFVNPTLANEFSHAAYRFGHSFVKDAIPRFNEDSDSFDSGLRLRDNFFCPFAVLDGVKDVINGMLNEHPQKVDNAVSKELTNHLFESSHSSFDLVALNIQRGREHGLPSYNTMREVCGLGKARDFSELDDHRQELRDLYQIVYRHVNDIDLWSGGVSETPRDDGLLGPTLSCIIGQQFNRLKYGDRFYYEHNMKWGFTKDQLKSLKRVTLSKVLCENSGIKRTQTEALKATSKSNPLVSCGSLPELDLSPWKQRK